MPLLRSARSTHRRNCIFGSYCQFFFNIHIQFQFLRCSAPIHPYHPPPVTVRDHTHSGNRKNQESTSPAWQTNQIHPFFQPVERTAKVELLLTKTSTSSSLHLTRLCPFITLIPHIHLTMLKRCVLIKFRLGLTYYIPFYTARSRRQCLLSP